MPTRLVAGFFILKHMQGLSDKALCARSVENPYFKYFCGEASFCHQRPFDCSSLTRWRQRLGEEQPKAVAHPPDARLMHRALEKLVVLAERSGVTPRQSGAD